MSRIKYVALDDESTWPIDVLKLLEVSFEELERFEIEKRRIDRLIQEDVLYLIDPPRNRFQAIHDGVLSECMALTVGLAVVGYHCSRLHESEIASVKARGLEVLSTAFLINRIRNLEAAKILPRDIAQLLISTNQAHKETRQGKVWFIFNRRLLSDEGGVNRLLRYWGGESLYWEHSIDPTIAPWLESIGVPCIIEASIPIASIASSWTDIPGRMMAVYLKSRGVSTELQDVAEGYVIEDVPGESIRRVIKLGEPDFVLLTRHHRWASRLN